MQNFLKELKRRNVIKALVSYAVVSWLILQVGALVFPMFGINQALLRWVFVALAVGLPVWIVFAYIYELTPEGFKKTDEVDAEESIRSNTGKKLNAYYNSWAFIGGDFVSIRSVL